ncbi:SCO-spondin-like [Physella acuta]|uniref:SCO-spondin-like n=1 Tax=Physella acuta TaxID=109671 RepID=UPI0027DE6BA7|nr:SCO-spondin-like [Physella acuta]
MRISIIVCVCLLAGFVVLVSGDPECSVCAFEDQVIQLGEDCVKGCLRCALNEEGEAGCVNICPTPECEDGVEPVIPFGKCCPVCDYEDPFENMTTPPDGTVPPGIA